MTTDDGESNDKVFDLKSSPPPDRKRLGRRFSFPVKSERRRSIRGSIDHGHRDLPFVDDLTRSDHIVYDVKEAIEKICEVENWKPHFQPSMENEP